MCCILEHKATDRLQDSHFLLKSSKTFQVHKQLMHFFSESIFCFKELNGKTLYS